MHGEIILPDPCQVSTLHMTLLRAIYLSTEYNGMGCEELRENIDDIFPTPDNTESRYCDEDQSREREKIK